MEQPVKILIPQKKIPFTLAVFVRLLVLIPIFGMSILMIATSYQDIQTGQTSELMTIIPGIFFLLMSSLFLVKIFVLDKRRLGQLQYLFYSDRLVIYNQIQDQILYELFYNEFPKFTFHENLNNFGYIVIGKSEPIIAKNDFRFRFGVNMKDPDIMLENLPDVKKEYLFMKELIETHQAKNNTFSWEFDQP